MFDDDAQPASTSLVGILSSLAFERLISSTNMISVNMCMHLRLLVEISAALYSSDGRTSYAGLQSPDLWAIHAYVGTKVLQSLDIALSTALSTDVSIEDQKGLFLAVLATIIAVGYSRVWSSAADIIPHSSSMSGSQLPTVNESSTFVPSQPQEYIDAQKQLLCFLAHHLVLTGQRAKLLDPSSSAVRVIEDASRQWKRRATFEWMEMPAHTVGIITEDQNTRSILDTNSQCRSHLSRSHPVSESCRPAGGFGTCIKDVNRGYYICGPSPMDQLLEGTEQISLEPRFHGCPSTASDFDSSPGARPACGTSSISETTISTPQWTPEGTFPWLLCQYCQNYWIYDEMSIHQSNACPFCVLPPSNEALSVSYSVNMPSVPEKIGALAGNNPFAMLPDANIQGNHGLNEMDCFSTTVDANEVYSMDRTLGQVSEVPNRLSSVNLLV